MSEYSRARWRSGEYRAYRLRKTAELMAEADKVYGTVCKCPRCRSTKDLQFDHIFGHTGRRHLSPYDVLVGLKKAGWPDTVQRLCRRCNQSKGDSPECRLSHKWD